MLKQSQSYSTSTSSRRRIALSAARNLLLSENTHLQDQNKLPNINQITDIVLVATSSRGGSSFFMEILRHCSEILHLRGEAIPMMRMAGLMYPENNTGSDALFTNAGFDIPLLQQLLLREMGAGCDPHKITDPLVATPAIDMTRFARDLYLRLSIQWPAEGFDPDQVRKCMQNTFNQFSNKTEQSIIALLHSKLFHVHFLNRVRVQHPNVNPYYYDIPAQLIHSHYPEIPTPQGPPTDLLIEEPPFLAISPWEVDTNSTGTHGDKPPSTLVLKAPGHAYQLAFLKTVFPQARCRVIHLTRNPAAAINGLYDGWLHHGFFVQAMPVELQIKGYSDQFPRWGKRWWNFDLPPSWEQYTHAKLEEVCAFQWTSTHQHIQDFLAQQPLPTLRVRYEDLIGGEQRREAALHSVCTWLNISKPGTQALTHIHPPPIMTTSAPNPDRWKKRASIIQPLIESESIKHLAQQLGY
ncbi:sulfotransferase [Teredinibacter franksiae]|uniref:sulfotransferase n=1 Tax=Teredinibacter franksiae TaxID=2761453 RepID=UPI001623A232|nr:sulfotransferase [Teredinibacter franksiae]